MQKYIIMTNRNGTNLKNAILNFVFAKNKLFIHIK